MSAPDVLELAVGGRTVRITRPEKILYPATGFTKRDLVEYLVAVAPAMLPHLAGRAVTLARFPDGVDGGYWFQANCPGGKPDWLPVAEVTGTRGQTLRYCRLEEPAALAWAANTGAIELHPFLARADRPGAPTALVFDLDPAPPAALLEAAAAALVVRRLLARAGLAALPKTSGASGLHVVVPLDGTQTFDETKAFVRAAAEALAAAAPDRFAARLSRSGRGGKVLIDWRQNAGGLQTVAPYSLRGTPLPLVSTPVSWDEVEDAVRAGDAARLAFGPAEVLARLERLGDPFAPALAGGQRVPAADPSAEPPWADAPPA
ncbi:non-homologous end-joining DNA ligase [Anaeromyxobacter oryzae]|uniref:ATP-dependent DNA ligase n=1 Tax=Anaeromyxobacter oryzae TaxID=2918170 RepID=A0ABM7WQR6_9BACT|nr:non-homologous end-joining DNA ligase [Anaeromyxobacter oryzae]BDG01805.1 ATP-dependent DNA ligase [Anaeromyxobacter oryzae]